ncbi:MAG: aspartate kinase, partial [Clostridia bacterium]|nr:aspartate kinase [Clostridia bacterium]
MKLVVQKYGGSSVKDKERVMNVARRIVETYDAGNNVIVVVSAQGDTTDDLIEKAKEINSNASKREMDMLLSTGEQISISLLAMAIEKIGRPVISLTGWQAGFQTDKSYGNARIRRIDTERLKDELDKQKIIIVAGFQGINKNDDITTLGRGGSDTSAVALAAALNADICEIYTDVDGVYTADPRIVKSAKKLKDISYDEMLELA